MPSSPVSSSLYARTKCESVLARDVHHDDDEEEEGEERDKHTRKKKKKSLTPPAGWLAGPIAFGLPAEKYREILAMRVARALTVSKALAEALALTVLTGAR